MSQNLNIKQFITLYYRQLHFNNMPPEVRVVFDKYYKDSDYNGNMKEWEELFHIIDKDKRIRGENKNLPDFSVVDEDELKKLYEIFRESFIRMNSNKNKFAENKPLSGFLSEYYSLFSFSQSFNKRLEDELNKLKDYINKINNDKSYSHIKDSLSQEGFRYLDLENIQKQIEKHDYNDDFFRKIGNLSYIINYYDQNNQSGIDWKIINNRQESINPFKFDLFKQNLSGLLRGLYNKNIREGFNNFGNENEITTYISKALEKVSYQDKDSDNYIPPKNKDKLTLKQQISRWYGNTYEDYLEKFIKLRGDKIFFSKSAELIVKAVHSSKIKPTDGLDAVLKNADNIKNNLTFKSPTAVKHFNYLVSELKNIKQTMPSAFEGALRNGKQLRYIVLKLCSNAIKNGKQEEVKTLLEVLSVIKYSNTTSRIMDIINKEKLVLFSDPSLSWNQNDGIKFITSCLDKTIKTGVQLIGYGLTFARNKIMMQTKINNSSKNKQKEKFQTDNKGKLLKLEKEYQLKIKAKEKFEKENDNYNKIQKQIDEKDNLILNNDLTILENKINIKEKDYDDTLLLIKQLNQDLDIENNKSYKNLSKIQDIEKDIKQKEKYLVLLDTEIKKIKDEFKDKEEKIQTIEDRKQKFATALEIIDIYNKDLDKIQKEIDFISSDKNKDILLGLFEYWNVLNTGVYNRTWSLKGKSAKQKTIYDKLKLSEKLIARKVPVKKINKIV